MTEQHSHRRRSELSPPVQPPRRTRHVFHNAAAPGARTHRLVVVTRHEYCPPEIFEDCSDSDSEGADGGAEPQATQPTPSTLTLTLSMQAAKQVIPPAVLAKSKTMRLLLDFFADNAAQLRLTSVKQVPSQPRLCLVQDRPQEPAPSSTPDADNEPRLQSLTIDLQWGTCHNVSTQTAARLYASLTSSSVMPPVLRSLLSDALYNTVRKELVIQYGPTFNAAWAARRNDVDKYTSFISHSLSTILAGSERRKRRDAQEDEDSISMPPSNQAQQYSPSAATPSAPPTAAELKRLLDNVDTAQYPPKVVLPTLKRLESRSRRAHPDDPDDLLLTSSHEDDGQNSASDSQDEILPCEEEEDGRARANRDEDVDDIIHSHSDEEAVRAFSEGNETEELLGFDEDDGDRAAHADTEEAGLLTQRGRKRAYSDSDDEVLGFSDDAAPRQERLIFHSHEKRGMRARPICGRQATPAPAIMAGIGDGEVDSQRPNTEGLLPFTDAEGEHKRRRVDDGAGAERGDEGLLPFSDAEHQANGKGSPAAAGAASDGEGLLPFSDAEHQANGKSLTAAADAVSDGERLLPFSDAERDGGNANLQGVMDADTSDEGLLPFPDGDAPMSFAALAASA